jgi:hypothetical protein
MAWDVTTRIPIFTSAPVAGPGWFGRPILVQEIGHPGAVYWCVRTISGTYEWAEAARSNIREVEWERGVWVGSSPPGTAITYAAWAAGGTGYWGWIQTP